MNHWSLKGNLRRFSRQDLPVQAFITPKSKYSDTAIFNNGVVYATDAVKKRIENQKANVLSEIKHIQRHQTVIKLITNEFFKRFDLIQTLLEMVSSGEDPKKNETFWYRSKILMRAPIDEIVKRSEDSSRTFQIYQQLDVKTQTLMQSVQRVVKESDERRLIIRDLEVGFKFDEAINHFRSKKFTAIPLARYFLAMSDLLDSLSKIYQLMAIDYQYISKPKKWMVSECNISACGMKIQTDKVFGRLERLTVLVYLPTLDEVVQFEASIVGQETLFGLNYLSLNFELPDGKEQNLLLSYLQKKELKAGLKVFQKFKQSEVA